jgi:hypothetical protein
VDSSGKRPIVFKSYVPPSDAGGSIHDKDKNILPAQQASKQTTVSNMSVVQIARATSAAPSYFPPLEVKGHKFVGGSVGGNNKTLFAIEEIQQTFTDAQKNLKDKAFGIVINLGVSDGGTDGLSLSRTSSRRSSISRTQPATPLSASYNVGKKPVQNYQYVDIDDRTTQSLQRMKVELEFPYYRLDPCKQFGNSKTGTPKPFSPDALTEIEERTNMYLKQGGSILLLNECASKLYSIKKAREKDAARWKAFMNEPSDQSPPGKSTGGNSAPGPRPNNSAPESSSKKSGSKGNKNPSTSKTGQRSSGNYTSNLHHPDPLIQTMSHLADDTLKSSDELRTSSLPAFADSPNSGYVKSSLVGCYSASLPTLSMTMGFNKPVCSDFLSALISETSNHPVIVMMARTDRHISGGSQLTTLSTNMSTDPSRSSTPGSRSITNARTSSSFFSRARAGSFVSQRSKANQETDEKISEESLCSQHIRDWAMIFDTSGPRHKFLKKCDFENEAGRSTNCEQPLP